MRQPTAMPFGTSPIPPEVSRPVIEPLAFRKNERRRLSRVPLALPVRLRWLGPFGLETEISQTINATRGGMLTLSSQPRGEGSPVWVTFPFDSGNGSPEPEIPARVARCRAADSGMNAVGIRFERRRQLFMRFDRRQNPRVPIALLVRITQTDCDEFGERFAQPSIAWPEETMTMDISPDGLDLHPARLSCGKMHFDLSPRWPVVGRWQAARPRPARGRHGNRIPARPGRRGISS